MRKLSRLKSHNRKGMNSSWMIAPRKVTPIAKPANNYVTSIKHTRIDEIERLTRGHVNVVTELHRRSIFVFINIINFYFIFFTTIIIMIIIMIIMILTLYGRKWGLQWQIIGTALLAKELRTFILDYPIARVKFNSQNFCQEVIAIIILLHFLSLTSCMSASGTNLTDGHVPQQTKGHGWC